MEAEVGPRSLRRNRPDRARSISRRHRSVPYDRPCRRTAFRDEIRGAPLIWPFIDSDPSGGTSEWPGDGSTTRPSLIGWPKAKHPRARISRGATHALTSESGHRCGPINAFQKHDIRRGFLGFALVAWGHSWQ